MSFASEVAVASTPINVDAFIRAVQSPYFASSGKIEFIGLKTHRIDFDVPRFGWGFMVTPHRNTTSQHIVVLSPKPWRYSHIHEIDFKIGGRSYDDLLKKKIVLQFEKKYNAPESVDEVIKEVMTHYPLYAEAITSEHMGLQTTMMETEDYIVSETEIPDEQYAA